MNIVLPHWEQGVAIQYITSITCVLIFLFISILLKHNVRDFVKKDTTMIIFSRIRKMCWNSVESSVRLFGNIFFRSRQIQCFIWYYSDPRSPCVHRTACGRVRRHGVGAGSEVHSLGSRENVEVINLNVWFLRHKLETVGYHGKRPQAERSC